MQYSHRQVFLKENLSKEACSEHRTLYVRQPIQLPTSCHRTGNVEIVGNVKKKKKKERWLFRLRRKSLDIFVTHRFWWHMGI